MTENNQIITGMDVWQINVPVVSKRSHGIGNIEGGFEVVLLRLRTEAGLEGWGEAACWSVFTGSPEASFFALDRYIRPLVIGKTIADRQSIMLAARYAIAHASEAKSALETALLDIEGQIAEKPVWALLGINQRIEFRFLYLSLTPISIRISACWNASMMTGCG